jgi:glycosyltransferase involved in cell wall biosynthesis
LLHAVASACLSIGTANDHFYEAMGIEKGRRFLVPYAVDNKRFAEQAQNLTKQAARAQLRLPFDKQIVLFAGKFVPWKQPDLLLAAFASLGRSNVHLALAGDGEMTAHLHEMASRIGSDKVSFLGFMNQARIGIAYRSADLLVLPSSHEPWGLVVNEAMNFAVPALVSDRVGCAADLIRNGETGETFRHNDVKSLENRLASLLDDSQRLKRMGEAARERVQQWGFVEGERGLREALAFVEALG